jgi:hypothetical protein
MSIPERQDSLLKKWQEHKAYNLAVVKSLVEFWQKLPPSEAPLKAKIQECIEAFMIYEQSNIPAIPKSIEEDKDWEKKLKQALSVTKVEAIKSSSTRSTSPLAPPALPDLSKIPLPQEKLAHLKLLKPEILLPRQPDDYYQKNQMTLYALSIAALLFSLIALFK